MPAKLTHFDVLLSPVPRVSPVSTVPHLYTNLPILPLLWALGVLFVAGARRPAGRLVWLTLVVLAGYVALLASHRTWAVVPRFLYVIQFPYRLLTYATLIVCALVALALRAVRAMDPVSTAALARRRDCCGGLPGRVRRLPDRSIAGTLDDMRADIHQMERDGSPPNFYAPRDYRFIPDHPIDDVNLPSDRVVLDIPDSPFVEVRSGATRAGATADGLLVVDVDDDPSTDVVVGHATPLPARIGQCLTLLGIAMAVALTWRWWSPSRRCSSADGRD